MSADPIADMLCMISNANHKFHERVDIPMSKVKKNIAKILKEEGYVSDYKVTSDKKKSILRVFLRYLPGKIRALQGVKRISTPGLRVFRGSGKLPKVRGGLGTTIVSTSKGLMSDQKSRKENIGGEVIAFVW